MSELDFNGAQEPHLGKSVSIDQAASLLNVSRRIIYSRIREGRLRVIVMRGSKKRVLVKSFYDFGFWSQPFSTAATAVVLQVRPTSFPRQKVPSPPICKLVRVRAEVSELHEPDMSVEGRKEVPWSMPGTDAVPFCKDCGGPTDRRGSVYQCVSVSCGSTVPCV